MFHATGRKRAESLIETLTAITVIVIATAAALSVLRTSLRGNNVIGDKVVAMNLALEGIEAVRNMRDTNYLRFASDPDNCWDALDVEDVADCATADHLSDQSYNYYFLERDLDADYMFEWSLVGTNDDTKGDVSLYEFDFDSDSSTDLLMYAQDGLSSTARYDILSEDSEVYQRLITITEVGTDYINVTCTVTWDDKGNEREVTLTRVIANVY